MQAEEFIGLDIGSAHIGVARGNSIAKLAEPLVTLEAGEALTKLAGIIKANQAVGLVVGLPRNLRGEDTEQTKAVRQWVATAKSQINTVFYWQDEALTSAMQDSAQQSKHDDHARAAATILSDFLNLAEDDRMVA